MTSRKAGLGFIVLTLFLDVLGIGLVVPILPRVVEGFVGGSTARGAFWVGTLMAAYAAMQFLFSPVLGSLSDRFGRRPVLLISLLGQGVDYLLLTFAPSLGWFFAGRLIAGLCGASIGTATAYIADVSPPEKRAQNFGLVGMAFGLGFVVGPALSGALAGLSLPLPDALAELVGGPALSGMRLPFLAAAGLALTNAAWGLFVLPESLAPEHRRPFSWARANPLGTLLALSRYPVVRGLGGALVLLYLAQRGLESVWVLYTEHRYGWTIQATALSLTVVGLSAAVVQGGLVRRLLPALGERRAFALATAVSVVAYGLYGLAPYGWMLYTIIPLGALGGIAGPAAQGLMSRAVPVNEQGMLQGGVSSLMSLTSIVGPPLATNLFGAFSSPGAPVHLPGASFFFGALLVLAGSLWARRTFRALPEGVKAG